MDRDRHKVKRSSYTEEPVVSISVSSDGILLEADGVWLPGTVVQESRLLQVCSTQQACISAYWCNRKHCTARRMRI